ncbi:MAG TPA: hypothetical protein VK816_07030 [Jatrophihabitantaceae bacterium]|jgi:hypothetical protein|nr:hypothetical protein [Jatrophihabitantaceae bacterium]
MGFLDKAKEAANQALATAQQAAQQGQAKVSAYQQSRADGDHLYRELGETFYDEQRRGGDHQSVVAALAAVDQFLANQAGQATGSAPTAPGAPTPPPAPGQATPFAQPSPPPAAPPAPPAPDSNYN